MISRRSLTISALPLLALCGISCNETETGDTPDSTTQQPSKVSEEEKITNELRAFLQQEQTETLIFSDFDISKTESITSPYKADVLCEKIQDGRRHKAVAVMAYKNQKWTLVDMRLVQ